jgi:SMI1 / KNR4 family (SUKH-1)
MTATLKPLGMSEQDAAAAGPPDGKRQRRFRQTMLDMYRTPLPTAQDIDRLEQDVGPLPAAYAAFLMRTNGGIPHRSTLVTRDNERVVNFFFPLNHPPHFPDGLRAVRSLYAARVPAHMLPIASAGGGDLLLLGLAGERRGSIHYWDHDLECDDDDAADYFDNVECVAGSIDALLDRLCELG